MISSRLCALAGAGLIAGTVVFARGGADLPAEPAIVRAAYLGDEPGVAAAIAAKADVNAANAAGATALLYGASHIAIVRELLEHGANPNLAAKSGMTPLMAAAAQSDSYATVKLLLDHGADVHARIGKWEAALPHAIFGGDPRTIKLLLDRGAPAGSTAPLTTSPLVEAAYMGDLSAIKLLLDRGANPNDNGDFAGHALNWALYSDQPDCAAELIRRGSDLKFRSPWGAGTPPVVFAAYNQTGDPAIEQMLVARGAAVNAAKRRASSNSTRFPTRRSSWATAACPWPHGAIPRTRSPGRWRVSSSPHNESTAAGLRTIFGRRSKTAPSWERRSRRALSPSLPARSSRPTWREACSAPAAFWKRRSPIP